MQFRIEVKNESGDPWWETFDKEEVIDVVTATAWAKATVKWYNDTLRRGDFPRIFTGKIELLAKGTKTKKHQWRKQNIMTQSDHHGVFDVMQCELCGARARRYGLGVSVKMQRPFTTKKYKTCPGAPE